MECGGKRQIRYKSFDLGEDDLKTKEPVYKAYKRRFYIITVFSIFGLFMIAVWNTWAPVSESAKIAFGWSIEVLLVFPWLAITSGLLGLVPMMYILKKYGLRIGTLHCTFLMMVGTGLRCIPCSNFLRSIFCGICAVLAGYCLTLSGVAFTMLSAVWFPPNERNKATAFTAICGGNVAAAFSFMLPKIMINDSYITEYQLSNDTSTRAYEEIRQELLNLLYLEFGAFSVLFLMVLAYFPKEPPTPVSASAEICRVDFKSSFIQLFKSKIFWIVLLSYAVPNAVRNVFVAVMDEVLQTYDVSQSTSNLIGIFMSLSAIPSGVIASGLADYRKTFMKPLIIILTLGAGISYLFFVLVCYGNLPRDIATFYSILILGAFFTNGSVPLFFEYSCEMFYPVGEEVITGVLNGIMGILAASVFVALISAFSGAWLSVVMAISFLVWPPFLMTLPSKCQRHQTDTPAKPNSQE